MIKNNDQYVGDREPKNRLRHGQGIYTYSNQYFQYEGQWENGQKHGYGILRMNAPSGLQQNIEVSENNNHKFCKNFNQYEGEFQHGEITGQGVYKWANGNIYEGSFLDGEKHGFGKFMSQYEEYEGNWQFNQYSGEGELRRENGDYIKGYFLAHKPHGRSEMYFGDGQSYVGELQNGLKEGQGDFTGLDHTYTGLYLQDKRNGQGKLQFKEGFIYEGEWENDQPKLIPNRLVVKQIQYPLTEQELEQQQQQQEKQKGKDKKQQQQQQDESPSEIIEYEILGKAFGIEIQAMYQPPKILDPVQPTEEEIEELIKNWEKQNKKNKNPPPMPDFREPKMIDPPMIPVPNETGRLLKVTLVFVADPEKGKEQEPRTRKLFRIDFRQQIQERREEIKKQIEEKEKREAEEAAEAQAAGAKGAKKGAKKDAKKGGKGQQDAIDDKILLYKEDEAEEQKPIYLRNSEGIYNLENLEFPEDFPPTQGGQYFIEIEDANNPDQGFGQLEKTQIEIDISPMGGDPKKKKK